MVLNLQLRFHKIFLLMAKVWLNALPEERCHGLCTSSSSFCLIIIANDILEMLSLELLLLF